MLELLGKFGRQQAGAVGIIFGLTVVPLVGMVGAAVDYNRGSQIRVAAAAAADAAALEGVKGTGSFAERKIAAQRIFEANMAVQRNGVTYQATYSPVMVNGVETGFRVAVQGQIPAMITGLIGQPFIRFGVESEATSPKNENSDVVFVLDTTDSMEGARLASLKSATTQLLDDMQRRQLRPDQFRVAVVPFAQYVNIGMQNRNQPWLDVPADYQEPTRNVCRQEREVIGQTNCRMVTIPADPGEAPRTCMRDGVPRQCGGRSPRPSRQENQCDTVYGPNMVNVCHTEGGNWVRWQGCVGSRNHPLNTQDGSYNVRIPGLLGISCGSPVQDWTSDLGMVRSMINGLDTNGETYIPSGLIWGWRMLSTGIPFASRASTPAAPVRRYMVLVTDGMNTKSPNYPRHENGNTVEANDLTRQICQNMSRDTATGAKVYTIAFEVTDPTIKTLLEQCSRMNGGEFFDAANSGQLVAALQNIGRIIWAARLTR